MFTFNIDAVGYWQEPIKTLIGYEEYVSVPAWDECSSCGQIRK